MDKVEDPRIVSAEGNETAKNLLEDAKPNDNSKEKSEKVTDKSDAEAFASFFDQQKSDGDLSARMDQGSIMLSLKLQSLAGPNMSEYNSFLNDLQESIKAIPNTDYPEKPELVLKDFDQNTGTYKNAYIYVHADSWDSHEAYRIVQPGNTLSQIAKDSYEEAVKVNEGPLGYDLDTYKGFIIEKNGITDPDKLNVGDVLKMTIFSMEAGS